MTSRRLLKFCVLLFTLNVISLSCTAKSGEIDQISLTSINTNQITASRWFKNQSLWVDKSGAGSIWVGIIEELRIYNTNSLPRKCDHLVLNPVQQLMGRHSGSEPMWADFYFEEIDGFIMTPPKIGETWVISCTQDGKGIFLIHSALRIQEVGNTNAILSGSDQQYLLNLARQTVCWQLADKSVPTPDSTCLPDNVRQKLGCFVTLTHRTKGLRGCLGIFEREAPLYMNVISRAVAATQDSRFRNAPVTYDELKDIKIEISVLTEPKNLPFDSPADLLSKLRPGLDGVILPTKYGSSTYLPQVWSSFATKEEFLSHLCEKHGAPANTWRNDSKNVKVQIYQGLVFGEETYGRKVIGSKGAMVGKQGATLLGVVMPSKEGHESGGSEILKEGARLAPAAIVTWDSDILEPKP
jgi:AmmeMemoRadiSam system protein A